MDDWAAKNRNGNSDKETNRSIGRRCFQSDEKQHVSFTFGEDLIEKFCAFRQKF